MMKYVEVKGYQGAGEVAPHLYQWIENDKDEPNIILVRAYDVETQLWSGKLFLNSSQALYEPITIDSDELKDVKVVESFKEFIKGSPVESDFADFTEV